MLVSQGIITDGTGLTDEPDKLDKLNKLLFTTTTLCYIMECSILCPDTLLLFTTSEGKEYPKYFRTPVKRFVCTRHVILHQYNFVKD